MAVYLVSYSSIRLIRASQRQRETRRPESDVTGMTEMPHPVSHSETGTHREKSDTTIPT